MQVNCLKRCRNLYRQWQKPKELSLLREEYRSYLGDKQAHIQVSAVFMSVVTST